jgi:hypothetical protein
MGLGNSEKDHYLVPQDCIERVQNPSQGPKQPDIVAQQPYAQNGGQPKIILLQQQLDPIAPSTRDAEQATQCRDAVEQSPNHP